VGLTNYQLSIARVEKRVADKGHDVPIDKLIKRFPRTQQAIRSAVDIADASILVDNSRTKKQAFTLCRVQMKKEIFFDLRDLILKGSKLQWPKEVIGWMDVVCPSYLPYAHPERYF
jgi:hypothetical protein